MALFVLSFCPFDISVGVGAFVIGLSQISSFFSYGMFWINTLLCTLLQLLYYILKCNYFGMTTVKVFVKIISTLDEELFSETYIG